MNMQTSVSKIVELGKEHGERGRRIISAPGAIVEANRLGLTLLYNGGKEHPKQATLDGMVKAGMTAPVVSFVDGRLIRGSSPRDNWDGGVYTWGNPLVATTYGKFGEFHSFTDPKTNSNYRLIVDKEYWGASGLLAVPQGFDKEGHPIIRVEGKNGRAIQTLQELEKHKDITFIVDNANNFTLISNVARDTRDRPTEDKFGIPINVEPLIIPGRVPFELLHDLLNDGTQVTEIIGKGYVDPATRRFTGIENWYIRQEDFDSATYHDRIDYYTSYLGLLARGILRNYVCAEFPPSSQFRALAYTPQTEGPMS